jgi:hypothetical protein
MSQGAALFRLADRRHSRTIYYSRAELNELLGLYSRKVAAGEWRDYAIDHRDGVAIFSVFRHSHESPLFTIQKRGGREREYAVFKGPQRLLGGRDLPEVLRLFINKLSLVR